MGDGAEKKSTTKETSSEGDVDSALQISKSVPTHIRRLLYLGTESGIYHAQVDRPRGYQNVSGLGFNFLKAWDLGLFSDEMLEEYVKENQDIVSAAKSVESLFKNKEDKTTPKDGWPAPNTVNMVKEILNSHKGACRAAALFVLAACTRTKGPARKDAYAFVKNLESPSDLMLFIKYAVDLTPKHKGWGGGIRRAVKLWYTERCGPMELAEQVTRIRQRHNWSNKDIVKLIHPKAKDAVQQIVLAYIILGLGGAQKRFDEVPEDDESLKLEAACVLKYLEAADKLRKLRIPKGNDVECPQVHEAVSLIKAHKFTIEHCDDTMWIAPKIWEAVAEHMTLWQLIVYLPILRLNRVIKYGCELSRIILSNLKSAIETLSQSSDKKIFPPVSPALVLISMQTYRRKHCEVVPTKLWFRTHALMKEINDPSSQTGSFHGKSNLGHVNAEKRHSGLPRGISKPNGKVLEAMGKLLLATIKNLKPTGKRFILGVGDIQEKVNCVVNPYVVSFEAAALIYMCLESAEVDGAVKAFAVPESGSDCRKLRSAGNSMSNCAREIMQGMGTTPIKVDGWLDWLCKEKHTADVIVLLADEVFADDDSSKKLQTAFMNYRKYLKVPKAKLIIVSFVSEKLPVCSNFQDDALMVHGFDSNLPFIIQHFARGCF